MIAHLNGKIIDKADQTVVLDVMGVGYEVFCSGRTMGHLGEVGETVPLQIYTHYKSEGAALFGFLTKTEKELFLALIKVDSVGPKSALNILSAAAPEDLIELIEVGDVQSLSRLPKISKKIAEHVVVKLKGKLSALLLVPVSTEATLPAKKSRILEINRLKSDAQSALQHLGYKPFESEKALSELADEVWTTDLETVIRSALNDLSGSR